MLQILTLANTDHFGGDREDASLSLLWLDSGSEAGLLKLYWEAQAY